MHIKVTCIICTYQQAFGSLNTNQQYTKSVYAMKVLQTFSEGVLIFSHWWVLPWGEGMIHKTSQQVLPSGC